MSKINSDVDRFKAIVKNKVKHNLGKFVGSENLTAQQGKNKISIPLSHINLPRFTYGGLNGGTGIGDGEIGDQFGPSGKKSSKGNKAGDETADHPVAEFTPDELAELISEELNLPKLENKKGKINSEKNKYNKISNVGSESLRHNRRTFKEALKRDISSGSYNPSDPRIVPTRDDKRYKASSVKDAPDTNAVIFCILDASGSMGKIQRDLAKSMSFWIDLLLKNAYKEIENIFIVHDTVAKEVNREEFFMISSAGGTRISSAYKLCSEIIEKEYSFAEYNNYIFQFSDGDNTNIDNEICINMLKENILPNCNAFNYIETKSTFGSGDYSKVLEENIKSDKISSCKITNSDDILKSIKTIFEKGN